MRPHQKYERVRSMVVEIVLAREDRVRGWSSKTAARKLGFRNGKEFDQIYECLKENGKRIVDNGDWSGVEAAIYARFPNFEEEPEFQKLLHKFGDPRVFPGGRLFIGPT